MKHYMAVVACASLLQGCFGPGPGYGFRLPVGDAEAGRRAFGYMRCYACHDLRGAETRPDILAKSAVDVRVTLGSDLSRIKTYGQLVTSIINPSHELAPGYRREDVTVDGESLMASSHVSYVMTVQELIDIVTFLQPLYEIAPSKDDPHNSAEH